MTLTDRYVDATLRRVPDRQRADIEQELRTSIADAIDDRLESGVDAADAEVAVLTALGDPARLAAGYADRPMQLIGPALYLDYTRLLRTLLLTVVPAVAAGVAIVQSLSGDAAGDVVRGAVSAAVNTGVHVVCWTTLLFVLIERVPNARVLPTRLWTPAALPPPPTGRRTRYLELILESLAFVLGTAFILLSPVVTTQNDADGDPIGLLSPWLWDTGVVYVFVAVLALSLGFSFAKYYAKWTVPLAAAGALVTVVSSLMVIWFAANDKILNPAFLHAAGWSDGVADWTDIGLIVGSIAGLGSTLVEIVGRSLRR